MLSPHAHVGADVVDEDHESLQQVRVDDLFFVLRRHVDGRQLRRLLLLVKVIHEDTDIGGLLRDFSLALRVMTTVRLVLH